MFYGLLCLGYLSNDHLKKCFLWMYAKTFAKMFSAWLRAKYNTKNILKAQYRKTLLYPCVHPRQDPPQ